MVLVILTSAFLAANNFLPHTENKIPLYIVNNGFIILTKEILKLVHENLEKEILINQLDLSNEEKELIKGYNFLTNKSILVVANYGGEENEVKELREYLKKKELPLFPLAVKLEKEMEELSEEEKEEMG